MKLILKRANTYWYVLSVTLFYFICWPLFYYFSLKPERYKSMNKLRRAWAFTSSLLAGFRYRFTYEKPIDWSKTYIVCPNHTSNLDISSMSILVKNNCSFIGKDELTKGLVTRLFFKTVDIPVNRDSKMSSFRAFKQAAERLKNGITMIIFPEGKISDDYPPTLHEFKNGPFRLAIELKIPVVPVSSANTWRMLWDDGTRYGSRPGVCEIFVHKPIETANLTIDDADALRDEVYDIIGARLTPTPLQRRGAKYK